MAGAGDGGIASASVDGGGISGKDMFLRDLHSAFPSSRHPYRTHSHGPVGILFIPLAGAGLLVKERI